jgi:II/X family phage/plasmid replication protein
MIMVDWVSCLIPFGHFEPINAGNVTSVNPDGEVEWTTEKRLTVEGSFSSKVQIRSEHRDGFCSHIYFSGNPVKFLQGHNVWGSDDLVGLTASALYKALSIVRPDLVHDGFRTHVGMATISRVDLTSMYDLGNENRVKTWLLSAESSANLKHRGRGQFTGNTLYWGKKSQRWALKMYHKGSELKTHKIVGFSPLQLEGVTSFADRSLRVEVVIRGKELAEQGLSYVSGWDEFTAQNLYNGYLSRLEFSENMKTINDNLDLSGLPARLVAPVQLWREGHDLKAMYPRATWYRYRKEILAAISLDISLQVPSKVDPPSNVVPLMQVLEAKPMDVPAWASGTPLYFEPAFKITAAS